MKIDNLLTSMISGQTTPAQALNVVVQELPKMMTSKHGGSVRKRLDSIGEDLDAYFHEVYDGLRPMPHYLGMVLDTRTPKTGDGFDVPREGVTLKPGDTSTLSSEGDFWYKLDDAKAAATSEEKQAVIDKHFPSATPWQKKVMMELASEKSLTAHAEALKMTREKMVAIIAPLMK